MTASDGIRRAARERGTGHGARGTGHGKSSHDSGFGGSRLVWTLLATRSTSVQTSLDPQEQRAAPPWPATRNPRHERPDKSGPTRAAGGAAVARYSQPEARASRQVWTHKSSGRRRRGPLLATRGTSVQTSLDPQEQRAVPPWPASRNPKYERPDKSGPTRAAGGAAVARYSQPEVRASRQVWTHKSRGRRRRGPLLATRSTSIPTSLDPREPRAAKLFPCRVPRAPCRAAPITPAPAPRARSRRPGAGGRTGIPGRSCSRDP